MGISGFALGNMLRNPQPWDTMQEASRERYRKLHEWCHTFDKDKPENRRMILYSKGSYFRKKFVPKYRHGLDVVQIARDLTDRLKKNGVCVGYFAYRKLFITKKHLEKLLTNKLEWSKLPDHTKKIYEKMKYWTERSDEEFRALKQAHDVCGSL
jgi:hypothetical protein